MKVAGSHLLAILLSLTIFCAGGCGGTSTPRQLQSITISPATATAQNGQAQFTATGQFNTAPMTVTPLSVTWVERGPGIDIAGPGYSLTDGPLKAQCILPGSLTIVAFAPADPSAPASGPMSFQLYDDLVVNHTTSQEGGFIAATAQMTCP